ncbi:hypothetical protein BBJ28_00010717 [Nothophytophthora sp. Chile5]|nr:hypothetical protein BBJ28_00010717 [Nothophytophthora sp. Chile5]
MLVRWLDYKEEQEMEVEALESIYMEEFTSTVFSYLLTIPMRLALTLKAAIPATYPDVEPQLEILLNKGLSDTQHKEVKQVLAQQIEENMGMAMMYTLCEAVREYLVENNREGNVGCHQEMLRRMELRKKKEDKIEADKLDQHNASFVAWKEKFEAEMRGTQNSSQKDEATAKLTGTCQTVDSLIRLHRRIEMAWPLVLSSANPGVAILLPMCTGRQLWSKGLVTEDDAAEAEAEGDDDEGEGEDGDEQEEEEEEGEQAK